MPWGAVIGAVGAIGASGIAAGTASSNASAAAAAQQQELQATAPYNIGIDGSSVQFSSGGGPNGAQANLSPALQGIQTQLQGGSGQALGNLSNLQQTGGINPLLMNALTSYLGSTPNANPSGQQGLANSLMAGQGTQGMLGGMLAGGSASALQQLGSFNPQQAGSQYASLLAQQQAPGNALAANNLGQSLFNTGNLGSTGGANQLAALQQSQGAQWANDQAQGQQLGLQQQQSLATTAGNLGSASNGLLGQSFTQGAQLNQNLFANQQNQAQQGYQNMVGLNSAGQSNLTTQANLGTGMLQSGLSIDQYLQGLLQTGGNLGAARTGAAVSGAQTNLQGQVGANNAYGTAASGLLGSIAAAGQNYTPAPAYNPGSTNVNGVNTGMTQTQLQDGYLSQGG